MDYDKSKINIIISKILNTYRELFTKHIVVNACLFYDAGKVLPRNWGDDINYFLLKELFKRNIVCYDYSSIAHRTNKNNYLVIGSTLTLLCNSKTIVWGAGVIDPFAELPEKPRKVLAVRGPLTRKYLLERKIECPEVYGDPALLSPLIYNPGIKKKYKLGIIPHYSDFDSPILESLKKAPEVLFIKMEGYKNWTDVIDQINSCEQIASSSLHGLILAEAYKIPNLWIEIEGNLMGGHFKFHDFFLSIGKDRKNPCIINKDTTKEYINELIADWHPKEIDLTPLINAAPFKVYNTKQES